MTCSSWSQSGREKRMVSCGFYSMPPNNACTRMSSQNTSLNFTKQLSKARGSCQASGRWALQKYNTQTAGVMFTVLLGKTWHYSLWQVIIHPYAYCWNV